MKTNILPNTIGPIDILKIAANAEIDSSENCHAATLFAMYKLENILNMFSAKESPFSVADTADTFGFNFCNDASQLRMVEKAFREDDLVTGALMLAKSRKDKMAIDYGLLNAVVSVANLVANYKCEGEAVRFEHLKWKHEGKTDDPTLPLEVTLGFAIGEKFYDLSISDDYKKFTICDRDKNTVAEGKLSGVGMKSSVAKAIAKLRKEVVAADISIEDVL